MLTDLDDSVWKTRIAEPQRTAFLRWHGDTEARDAVSANRGRLRSAVGKAGMRKRAEIVERSFAHLLERGGPRRTWLRARLLCMIVYAEQTLAIAFLTVAAPGGEDDCAFLILAMTSAPA